MRLLRAIFALALLSCATVGLPRASWGDVTACPMPVAYSVSTYCAADCPETPDYTVLSAWETATRGDLVTAHLGQVLDVLPGTNAETTAGINMACGAGHTDADYFRVVRGSPNYGPIGNVWMNPKPGYVQFWAGTSQGYKWNINNEDYAGIYNLYIDPALGCYDAAIYIQDSANVRIIGNIIAGFNISAACGFKNNRINHVELYKTARATSAIIVNNMFEGLGQGDYPASAADAASLFMGLGATAFYVYNNTFTLNTRPGYFNFSNNPVVLCTNNIRYGNTVSDAWSTSGSIGTGEYTVTTDATTGVNFVDAASLDFHLAAPSPGAKNVGTDLTADPVFPFNYDIDWNPRPPGLLLWDIGADEMQGALWKKYLGIW